MNGLMLNYELGGNKVPDRCVAAASPCSVVPQVIVFEILLGRFRCLGVLSPPGRVDSDIMVLSASETE